MHDGFYECLLIYLCETMKSLRPSLEEQRGRSVWCISGCFTSKYSVSTIGRAAALRKQHLNANNILNCLHINTDAAIGSKRRAFDFWIINNNFQTMNLYVNRYSLELSERFWEKKLLFIALITDTNRTACGEKSGYEFKLCLKAEDMTCWPKDADGNDVSALQSIISLSQLREQVFIPCQNLWVWRHITQSQNNSRKQLHETHPHSSSALSFHSRSVEISKVCKFNFCYFLAIQVFFDVIFASPFITVSQSKQVLRRRIEINSTKAARRVRKREEFSFQFETQSNKIAELDCTLISFIFFIWGRAWRGNSFL